MKSWNNKTGYKGVYAQGKRFTAETSLNKKKIYLGVYDTAEEAAEVYDAFEEKYKSKRQKYYRETHKLGNKINKQNSTINDYYGVYYRPNCTINPFQAKYCTAHKDIHLGCFMTATEAAIAVNNYIDCYKIDHYKNNIPIKDIIELERKKKKEQKQRNKQQEELELRKPRIKEKHGPEYKLQQKIISYLMARGWIVKILTAGLYNYGLSDLYATHKRYGGRFIEIKVAKPNQQVNFTPAQYKYFPEFCANGTPIYILTAANEENYKRLFGKSNLWIYMGGLNDGK